MRPTTKTKPWAVLLFALLFGLALPSAELAADETEAKTFLVSLGERAIDVAKDSSASAEDKESRIRALLKEGFDVPIIARLVLGKHWRGMDDAQRKEFLSVFEDVMVQQSLVIFGKYSGETLDVTGAGPDRSNPKLLAITTNIKRPNGAVAKVNWRLRKRGEDFKIVDIVAEGISMALTLKQEYSTVIEKSGGKVDDLIAQLRKNAA